MQVININTPAPTGFIDITSQVQQAVSTVGITSGLCCVYVPHTTAAVIINEHADPDVAADMAFYLNNLVQQSPRFRHMEGNSPAHIKAAMLGNSITVIIEQGRLALGTWQGIFLCEFDGPRSRSVWIKVITDAYSCQVCL